jgi:hypothetical protein
MNRTLFNKGRFFTLLGGAILCLAACGSGVSGTYTSATGLVTLDLQSGGKAVVTMMGQTEQCTYNVDGKNLNLTCGTDKTVWGIHDDGTLTGPGFIGALTKRKS